MRKYFDQKVMTALCYELDKLDRIETDEDWLRERKRLSQKLSRLKKKGAHSTEYLSCRLTLAMLIYKRDLNL